MHLEIVKFNAFSNKRKFKASGFDIEEKPLDGVFLDKVEKIFFYSLFWTFRFDLSLSNTKQHHYELQALS